MNEHPSRQALDADEAAALQALGWRGGPGESGCPDSSLLIAADDGVLDDDVASRVRSHAAACPTCQQLTRDLAVVLSEAPTAAEVDRIGARMRGGRAGGRVYWWFGAAGVALAAGLAWVIVAPRSSAPPPLPELELARATPLPTPSVFVVDRPSIPPGEIELTVRGDAPAKVSLEMQVAAALDLADSGDVSGAFARLEALWRDHQASRAAGLALGAVQLRLDRNADAVAALERARLLKTEPALDDEVDWFLAIARVRIGDRAGARSLLEGLCQRTGARSASACAGVAELSRAPSSR